MDPRRPSDFKLLTSAVKQARLTMAPFREKRTKLVELMAGSEYTGDKKAKKVYLNLLALAINIYVRQIAVRAPTAKVTTPHTSLRPLAKDLSLACKDVAQEVKLGQVLRKAAVEAMVSPMAVVKKGLVLKGTQEYFGEEVDVTDPFVKLVSFDDYVRDMSSRSARNPAFEGDTYLMDLEELETVYPDAKKLELSEDDLSSMGDDGVERAESVGHNEVGIESGLGKRILVQDVWLPKERLMVTYVLNKPGNVPLSVVEYDVSDSGPYAHLWFSDVPDNAMPLPPFSLLKNLHELANSLFLRLVDDAKNHKRVTGFADEESANRFGQTLNGHAMHWQGAKPESIEAGGIDPRTMALLIQVRDIFSWASGNLDSLGGLSSSADTARQETLLSKSSSAQMADMQDAMVEFSQSIFRDLAWFEWTDPVRKRTLQKQVPGTDIVLAVPWTPETREGDFLDFNFAIIPQSMREESPEAKIEKLNAIMQQTFLPMLPILNQQGMTIDIKAWVALISDYSNIPELEGLVVPLDPSQLNPDGPVGNPTPTIKSDNSTRRYIRENVSTATRTGKEATLVQSLMGGNSQPSENAQVLGGIV